MSNSNLEIDITLPLKQWKQCGCSYTKIKAFCESKIKQLDIPTEKVVPTAEMYRLCIDMLKLAKCNNALLIAVTSNKFGTVFQFQFDTEGNCNKFYELFVKALNRHKIYRPED